MNYAVITSWTDLSEVHASQVVEDPDTHLPRSYLHWIFIMTMMNTKLLC